MNPVRILKKHNLKNKELAVKAASPYDAHIKGAQARDSNGAKPDLISSGVPWVYSKVVKEHFFHPKNFLLDNPKPGDFDTEGMIGSPACGDIMRFWLKIDKKTERIKDCKWRTFGCASAIAATSMLSVMLTERGGMKLDKALKIKPQDITKRLYGLPERKIHCSVLGDKALKEAINKWLKKTGQFKRIIGENAKIIDPTKNITKADIKRAVSEGARTLKEVQEKTKVGIGYPKCIPQVKRLIKFYLTIF